MMSYVGTAAHGCPAGAARVGFLAQHIPCAGIGTVTLFESYLRFLRLPAARTGSSSHTAN